MAPLRRCLLPALFVLGCATAATPRPPTGIAQASTPASTHAPRTVAAPAEPSPAPAPAAPTPTAPEPAYADQAIAPLSPEHAAIFLASPEDEPAEELGGVTQAQAGKHYLAGNEKTPHAFYPFLRGIGGGYVGVGSDQAYLLMGWMRPEVAWLIDYDDAVVEIHAVYRVFFEHAATPEAMLALWTEEDKDRAAELLLTSHPGAEGKHLRRLYLNHRGWIHRRLVMVGKTLRNAGVPSFLDDEETYDFIRELLAAGRVRPLVANLLEDKAVRGVADAARAMDVPIRVLYLSNAEEYWNRYPRDFRDNIAALPFAGDAKILRTLLIWSVNMDYRYNVQPASNYLEWLAQSYTRTVYDIVHARGRPDPAVINVFETNAAPQESPAFRRSAQASR